MAERRITRRHVLARLLLEAIQRSDATYWDIVTEERMFLENHIKEEGNRLVVDESTGIAFVRGQTSDEDDVDAALGEAPIPKTIRSQPLGYWPSLMAAILRAELARHEEGEEGGHSLIFEESTLLELMRPHMEETEDDKTLVRKLKEAISRLEDLSVLRRVPANDQTLYRVEPIIKARIPVHELQSLRDQLKAAASSSNKTQEQEEAT